MNGKELIGRELVSDLGVTKEKDLRFETHIQLIKSKANARIHI